MNKLELLGRSLLHAGTQHFEELDSALCMKWLTDWCVNTNLILMTVKSVTVQCLVLMMTILTRIWFPFDYQQKYICNLVRVSLLQLILGRGDWDGRNDDAVDVWFQLTGRLQSSYNNAPSYCLMIERLQPFNLCRLQYTGCPNICHWHIAFIWLAMDGNSEDLRSRSLSWFASFTFSFVHPVRC